MFAPAIFCPESAAAVVMAQTVNDWRQAASRAPPLSRAWNWIVRCPQGLAGPEHLRIAERMNRVTGNPWRLIAAKTPWA